MNNLSSLISQELLEESEQLLEEIDRILTQNNQSSSPILEIREVEQLFRHFTFSIASPTSSLSPLSDESATSRSRYRFIDPYRRYSSEEYSFARDEFKKLAESHEARQSEVSTKILNVILDFYYDHNREKWPLQQDIIQVIRNMPCGCIFAFTGRVTQSCFQMYEEEDITEMLYYYLFSKAHVPRCEEIRPILEYNTLTSEYPSQEHLQEYILNTFSFYSNPEEYHQQDKMHVPVSHPERIPVIAHVGDPIGCGICQSDIVEPQDKIQLSGCRHSFHAHSGDCLESASIYTWFQSESTCPLCKEKV
jgi:Ring finger domain